MIFINFDKEYVYTLVSISGDSVIGQFVNWGEGPGELLRPSTLQFDTDGNIYMYDDVRQRMYQKSSVQELVNEKDTIGSLYFKEATGGYLVKTTEGYIGDNLYGDGNIFTFFDNEGNVKSMFGLVPGTEISEHAAPNFYMAYQVIFAVSPDKTRMCAAGSFHDWLAFFDVSGDTPRLIKEYFTSPPIVEASGSGENYHLKRLPTTIDHFLTISSYNDGVFLNYRGASREDIKKKNYKNQIMQFNWDGNFVDAFSPREKIYDLNPTQDGSQLYATFVCDSTSEMKLIRYDLK